MNKEQNIQDMLNFSIINIDKPAGPTSFSVSDFVRKKLSVFGVKKTSHFGTLDPEVTGVLPIAIGRACKLTGFFLGHDKTYLGVMHIHKEKPMQEIQEIINEKFLGKIMQKVPKKSAVKRQVREREIIEFELLEQQGKDILFKARVQGGTYIRKLIHDLGEEIGGAHMAELRRTEAGIFNESNCINLYDFEKAIENNELEKFLISGEQAIKQIMPSVQAKKQSEKQLLTGKPLFQSDFVEGVPDKDLFSVFIKDKLIGIYKKADEGDIIARAEWVYN